jgi:hypothetical protein
VGAGAILPRSMNIPIRMPSARMRSGTTAYRVTALRGFLAVWRLWAFVNGGQCEGRATQH